MIWRHVAQGGLAVGDARIETEILASAYDL